MPKALTGGLSVHYRDQGNPDGVPVVLIHGTAASLHTWEPLVEELGSDYRLITLTLPGHGLTGPHPEDDYSYAASPKRLMLSLTNWRSIPLFLAVIRSAAG